MKALKVHKNRKVDILIYDAEASWILEKSIPPGAITLRLETRRTINMVWSWRFIWRFVKHLLGERKFNTAHLFSLFDTLECRVIITKSSIQPHLGRYADIRPDCLVIAIQSSTRSSIGTKHRMNRAPVYYCFGPAEQDLFSILEIPAKEINCVGSYDMGVYFESREVLKSQGGRHYDLCFVSGYRPQLESADLTKNESILKVTHDLLLEMTVRLCRENGLSLLILGRMRHPERDEVFPAESRYFAKYCEGVDFSLICSRKSKLSSYAGLFSAEVVIHIYSTLGWEGLGMNKKVLFGGGVNAQMMTMISMLYWEKFLPEQVVLQSADYLEFRQKTLSLLSMDKLDYEQKVSSAARYYMAQDASRPPHQIIRERVEFALQESR